MMNKHDFAKVVQAWADGAEIQFRHLNSEWYDSIHPQWSTYWEWRIKPKTITWRAALFGGGGYNYVVLIEHQNREQATEQDEMFIRWINDWQEIEI